MRPQKFPDIPVSLEENTELPGTTSSEPLSPLLIALPQGWAGCTALTGTSFPSGKQISLPVLGNKVHLKLATNESLVLKP